MVRGLGKAEAIAKVLVPGRPANKSLYMGSVMTNIGHTEAASWIASNYGDNCRIIHTQLDERRLKFDHSWSGKVVIACINSQSSVTISGDYGAIEELKSQLQIQKIAD